MKFILMMHAPGTGWEKHGIGTWAAEDIGAHLRFMKTLVGQLSEEGVLVAAEGLAGPEQAKIVRAGKGGAPAVTDGPFPETKEFLAGYWIVDVETAEQALAIAARASAAPGKGGAPLNMPIEVRQIMSGPPPEL